MGPVAAKADRHIYASKVSVCQEQSQYAYT